jgi:Trk-type K+ transport system membrane component
MIIVLIIVVTYSVSTNKDVIFLAAQLTIISCLGRIGMSVGSTQASALERPSKGAAPY